MKEADQYWHAERLFEQAIALAPDSRDEFLEHACGLEADLVARVRRMLGYAERTGPRMAFSTGGDGELSDAKQRFVGTHIGPYRIVQVIGEGGFGTVYSAEQEHPVRRTVALKILKGGMDSHSVIARFEAEKQMLALMEHPCIARIFDAGQTKPELGAQPYFVMEFVRGEPITRYCDRKKLDLRARLELFITVCQAVQHAHQKGIIHRDLKPSNIMVGEIDGVALPKVIDFGIAKVIQRVPMDSGPVTNRMELLGTPQYMSPEQAESSDKGIDTRSDVYSLGAVLYELVTGTTPLDPTALRKSSYREVLQMIVEQRVQRPSLRAKTLSSEVDWIIMKALDSDRDRRYSSALALAEDIRRHLNDQPVQASPPSRTYVLRKFIRRHRVSVAATIVVMLVALGGGVATALAMLRAQDSARQALEIDQFMHEVLTSVEPDANGADVRLAQVLHNASATASQRFAGHPELEARVSQLLGEVYANLALWTDALPEVNKARTLWLQVAGPDDSRTLAAQVTYARTLGNNGHVSDAALLLQDLAPRIEQQLGPNHPIALESQRLIGLNETFGGHFDKAEPRLRGALQRALAANVDERTVLKLTESLVTMVGMKMRAMHQGAGDPIRSELETMCRSLLEREANLFGPESMQLIMPRMFLARAVMQRGDFASAAEMSRSILNATAQRLGECHSLRSQAMLVLALSEYRLGHFTQAADMRLQEINCDRTAGNPIVTMSTIFESLPFLVEGKRWSEGEAAARELSETLKSFGGGHGTMLITADLYVAKFVSLQGKLEEAEQMFQALMPRQQAASDDHELTARLNLLYAGHLAQQGKFDEALTRLDAAAGITGGAEHGTWDNAPGDLSWEYVRLYRAWNKPDKAEEYEALRMRTLATTDWRPLNPPRSIP